MSILRTYNLQNPDSSGNNIELTQNGGAIVSGVATAISGFSVGTGAGFSVGTGATISGSTNTITASTNGSEKARIDANGYFGIGTDAPSEQLHLFNSSGSTIRVETTGTYSPSTLELRTPASGRVDFRALTGDAAGRILYSHVDDSMRFSTKTPGGSRAEKLRITGIGSVGIGEALDPINRLHVEDNGASITSAGNAILNSTQKGIRLLNANNDDTSLGLWFTTGDSHHAGITGQRSDSANTWGTDLRFYTHEDATNDLTYARERLRINPHGLLTNRKGNNAINTGGSILGRYKYVQQNQSQNYEHNILGPDGRNLNAYLSDNVYAKIRIQVTGTGTTPAFCEYYYTNNSSTGSGALTNIRGNSSASSNRPYMVLNGQLPAWKMNHSGGYLLDIEVAMYGGKTNHTYTEEYGYFTANP
tara:strand:- start:161 stop:1414 length:1254 start_codon:yes stop_codon:yes gene_type:complete